MKKVITIFFISVAILTLCACNDFTNNLNNSGDNDKLNNSGENAFLEYSGEHISGDPEIVDSGDENIKISGEILNSGDTSVSGEVTDNANSSGETTIPVVATNLSNTKYAWGFRRMKDEKRPEFSANYIKVLDDYDGIYAGNPDEKVIYLTFDEGYENGYTASILDTLYEKDITAVFFVTMPYVKQNPELVQRMIDEGHIVGNHTVNHPSMPDVTNDEKLKKEIMDLHDYVKENFNYEMEFLRPPKGEYSERTVALAKELGYRTVLWSSAYDDWDTTKQDRLEYAKGMILNYVHNGCVMLLHAVSKDNTALLGEVLDELQNRGYELRPLTEFE